MIGDATFVSQNSGKSIVQSTIYPVGTQDVSAQDLQDSRKFFYGRYKKDLLVYQGLNVKYAIKFLMATKKK
jgi:hypothetical protein